MSACRITIRERVSKSAMCAVCSEREREKKACTPVEDKQGFQRYDISINPVQDMNCSVILMVHSGTVGADRHVLHMVNCLAAGVPRSATHPHHHLPPFWGLRSHLSAVICKQSPLLQANQQAAAWSWAECSACPKASPTFNLPLMQCQHFPTTTAQPTHQDV